MQMEYFLSFTISVKKTLKTKNSCNLKKKNVTSTNDYPHSPSILLISENATSVEQNAT